MGRDVHPVTAKKRDMKRYNMDVAIGRCYRAVPATLEGLRPRTGAIALRCVLRGCSACKSFDADERAAFEPTLGVRHVLPWGCDDEARRRIATEAGVTDLPAYVVVPATGPVRVVRP